MHKKLKIVSIVIGLTPILVFIWEAKGCIPEKWGSMCGLMTGSVGIAGLPIASSVYFFNPNYSEGTVFWFTVALVAGIIYAFVFYWLIRFIQKLFANRNS